MNSQLYNINVEPNCWSRQWLEHVNKLLSEVTTLNWG